MDEFNSSRDGQSDRTHPHENEAKAAKKPHEEEKKEKKAPPPPPPAKPKVAQVGGMGFISAMTMMILDKPDLDQSEGSIKTDEDSPKVSFAPVFLLYYVCLE